MLHAIGAAFAITPPNFRLLPYGVVVFVSIPAVALHHRHQHIAPAKCGLEQINGDKVLLFSWSNPFAHGSPVAGHIHENKGDVGVKVGTQKRHAGGRKVDASNAAAYACVGGIVV